MLINTLNIILIVIIVIDFIICLSYLILWLLKKYDIIYIISIPVLIYSIIVIITCLSVPIIKYFMNL